MQMTHSCIWLPQPMTSAQEIQESHCLEKRNDEMSQNFLRLNEEEKIETKKRTSTTEHLNVRALKTCTQIFLSPLTSKKSLKQHELSQI